MGTVSLKAKAAVHLNSSIVQAGEELSGYVSLVLPTSATRIIVSIDLTGQEKVTYVIGLESD